MNLEGIFARARRGFREELRLYFVAVTSLAVAFLCLAAALLAIQNLGVIAERWGESGHITVYLREGIEPAEVAKLSVVLEGLREVDEVRAVSSEEAREELRRLTELGADLDGLGADLFPASLEVGLVAGVSVDAMSTLAQRIGALDGVSDVETYRGWFERLASLLATGRAFASVVGVLVGFCVFAVVGNTIRLSVARRQREIEVMKLCGATRSFVRTPFILEGVAQSVAAALLSLVGLAIGFFALRGELDATLAMLFGGRLSFLGPELAVPMILAAASIGAASSALALRRYLEV